MIIKLNIENQDLNKSQKLVFNLEYKDINLESVNDLNIICKNTELKYLQLKLDHNFLEDEGIQRLMKIITCFKKLQVLHLHLGNNYFGEQGARYISIGLQKLTELKELKLIIFKNVIHQAGAFHISDVLQFTNKLQALSLNLVECNINSSGWQSNNINEQGNTQFCDFIQNNKTIINLEISLVLNNIGQDHILYNSKKAYQDDQAIMEETAYQIVYQYNNTYLQLSNIQKSLEDHTRVTIQCYQMGNMKSDQFKDFLKLLQKSFQSLNISQDNLKLIKAKLSPYIKQKEWNKSLMNLQFQDYVIQTEWPGYELHMIAAGAIAFYDSDSNDINQFQEEFIKLKTSKSRQTFMKLFIMGSKEQDIKDMVPYETSFCFLEDIEIEREASQITLQNQISQIIVDISINIALELEKLKSDPQNTVKVHMKEEKVTDSSKLKKIKEGRALKMMGDYCMMLLSFEDAIGYYSDVTPLSINDFEQEVSTRMKEAMDCILKTKFSNFFIEIAFKYMKVLSEYQFKLQFNDMAYYFEMNYTLNDKVESSQCFQSIATMYKQLGMLRKYGFYLRKAALLINKYNSNVCQKLMSIAAKYYKFYELSPFGEGKKSEQFWLKIQMAFLYEFIECLADQPKLKNQVQKHIINVFTNLHKQDKEKIYLSLRSECPYIPNYSYFIFEHLPVVKKVDIIPSNQLIRSNELEKKGLFIYNPFQKKNLQKLKFPSDELISFKITLVNSFGFDLQIDCIVFEVSGVEILNYPNNIFVSKDHTEFVIEQNIKPLKSGNLSIEAMRFRCFNTVYEHCIDERGFGLIYLQKNQDKINLQNNQKKVQYDLKNIEIFDKLPHLYAELLGDIDQNGNIVFEKSQKIQFQINLKKKGDLPVTQLKICMTIINHLFRIQYSFEEVGEVAINKNESITLIFVEHNSIFKQKKGNFKVLQLPKVNQSSYEVSQVTLVVSYMENNNSKFIKEIHLKKNITVKESILIDSMEIYDQKQKIVEDLKVQNYYLNDYFYVQMTFIKTDDNVISQQQQLQFGESNLHNQNDNNSGAFLFFPQNSNIIDNQFTLTFYEKQNSIDQCDLYSNNKRVTKIFKLSKVQKLIEEQDEEDSDPQEFMQKKFREIFSIKWKDVHRYSEGLLPLPSLDISKLKKIFQQPIQIKTNIKLLNEESQVQTYLNVYTIIFFDLNQVDLSNNLSCELRLDNNIQEGSEVFSFQTYYIQLQFLSFLGQETSKEYEHKLAFYLKEKMESSSSSSLNKNVRKNTKPRNILITQCVKLDLNSSNYLSLKLPSINSNYDNLDNLELASRYNSSTSNINSTNNGFGNFIHLFKKILPSHRPNNSLQSIEQARVTGFKKINESIPPRVTRLLHAIKDRDAKESRQILTKFTNKNEEKEYVMPRQFNLESFKLVRNDKNIQKIKNLMCHFINSHKNYFNKEVVNLPHYEKSAPFHIETMQFADNYLDDQKLIKKNFNYDEENLQRNNLVLEKVLLERLIKHEKNIPDRPDLNTLSIITQHIN
ncbi:hypothetical protein ABPG72_003884 [Tetrahymena utriculariae]